MTNAYPYKNLVDLANERFEKDYKPSEFASESEGFIARLDGVLSDPYLGDDGVKLYRRAISGDLIAEYRKWISVGNIRDDCHCAELVDILCDGNPFEEYLKVKKGDRSFSIILGYYPMEGLEEFEATPDIDVVVDKNAVSITVRSSSPIMLPGNMSLTCESSSEFNIPPCELSIVGSHGQAFDNGETFVWRRLVHGEETMENAFKIGLNFLLGEYDL